MSFGLTDDGLVLPRTADFLQQIRDAYLQDTQLQDVDVESDVLLGIYAGIVAGRLDSLSEIIQAVYDAFDENNANGVQLTNIQRLRGISRKGGTKSRVPLTLTGAPNAEIGVGLVVQGGGPTNTARWVTLADVVLSNSGTGFVVAEAEEVGATAADPGVVTVIVTPVTGLTSVTNAAAATPGADFESDDRLRLRGATSLQRPGAHTPGALTAAVLAITEVTDALVIDNPDNADAVIEGLTIPAHSYLVVVLPDPLSTETQSQVLQTIFDNVHFGVKPAGSDVTDTLTDSDTGTELLVGVNYGTTLSVSVAATLTLAPNYALADVEADLDAALQAYLGSIGMGDPLRLLTLCQLASTVPGIIGATFTINGTAADLEPTGAEKIGAISLTATEA